MTHPTAGDYTESQRKACYSVLIDLIHILGAFVDDLAIVGGMVPSLLIPNATEKHPGTMDIDVAINPKNIDDAAYATINKLLTTHGYRLNENTSAQFKYFKNITTDGQKYIIEVDLLTGEYLGDTGRNRRHEPIQDIKALKARGADLVFDRTETITISGNLPDKGGQDTVRCKIAGVVPFIVMKGIVLARRKKEKDAYDLEYVLRNYPSKIDSIAKLMKPDLANRIVQEALFNIANAFQSLDHYGPTAIVNFLEISNDQERLIRQQKSYQLIQELLSKTLFAKDT